mmetsp:Transcript_42571/g.113802  ORF Transcript_42571/g.113802 Transcript_42571/m.113802 type:complete len:197 (+) Transcript_42571:1698-2288(+)
MMGFNHYTEGPDKVKDYISVLEDLDGGWVPEATVYASRNLKRKVWEADELKQTKLPIGEILDTKEPSSIRIEADMPLEHLPFGAALFEYNGGAEDCEAAVPKKMLPVCGLVVSHSEANKCSCWVNLPTFKSASQASTPARTPPPPPSLSLSLSLSLSPHPLANTHTNTRRCRRALSPTPTTLRTRCSSASLTNWRP